MIKLNSQKDSTIQFDVDVKNMGNGTLQGYFRLMHENVEYGFPVQINGRRAKIVIPALDNIISGLTEKSEVKSKLEFVGGSDYVKAFEDDVELRVPPKVEKVQIVVKEKEKLAVSITSAELEEDEVSEARGYDDLPDDKLKKLYNQMKDEQLSAIAAQQFRMIVKVMKKRKLPLNEAVKSSGTPINIEVPDHVWEGCKPKKPLTDDEKKKAKKKADKRYAESKKLAAGKIKSKGGFADFFTEKTKIETERTLGHYHTAVLDDEGDGETTGQFPRVKNTKDHVHKIVGAIVQPEQKNGHKHLLKG